MPHGHELISVVIPTRNRQPRLAAALTSVRDQTWPHLEIIIVDDGSSDGTAAFLQRLSAEDDRVRVIRNDRARGGGGARNQGIEAASGPYVAFLDDDDLWLPSKLEKQYAMMQEPPRPAAVSCSFVVQFPSGRRRHVRVVPASDEQQILRVNHLGGASMCFTTKEALTAVQGFDAALSSGQDWDLWIKLRDQGDVRVCETPLVCYVPHRDVRITSSVKSAYESQRRIYRRYLPRMSPQTRRVRLCELLYLRTVLLGRTPSSRLFGLFRVLKLADQDRAVRYVYRYMKSIVRPAAGSW
jgi:glycosyltransferase involved in cell wall biosynthesis